jgi:hypothetical protein
LDASELGAPADRPGRMGHSAPPGASLKIRGCACVGMVDGDALPACADGGLARAGEANVPAGARAW